MENTFWLFFAIMFISFISFSYLLYITLNELRDILPAIYYSFVCSKDVEGNYIFSQKTNKNFCKSIQDAASIYQTSCNFIYSKKEHIEACEKSKEMINKRIEDCVDFVFNNINKTSVRNNEIDEICNKLN